MQGTRWRTQDGFIREIVWFFVVVLVIAVVVLDGIAILSANQSVQDDALRASRAAATEYVQTQNPSAAKSAAQQALLRRDEKLTGFQLTIAPDGSAKITVSASAHADTRVFKFLRYVGLEKWVDKVTNPTATSSSQ